MATPTITIMDHTNQTREISSTISKECYLYYMHKLVIYHALCFWGKEGEAIRVTCIQYYGKYPIWLCINPTVYGTICGVSAIMVSTVVGVVSVYVCIRCKHKGNVHIWA